MSITLDLLVLGQSNAQYFDSSGAINTLAARVETLLGWDGVNQKINLIEGTDLTTFHGSALLPGAKTSIGIPIWLGYANGKNASAGFVPGHDLKLVTSYLSRLPASVKANPTIVIEEHNETDDTNPSITAKLWQSTIR